MPSADVVEKIGVDDVQVGCSNTTVLALTVPHDSATLLKGELENVRSRLRDVLEDGGETVGSDVLEIAQRRADTGSRLKSPSLKVV